jgi:exopolysaccharide biosynthesis polyprenyl glycosylphosphotransferase
MQPDLHTEHDSTVRLDPLSLPFAVKSRKRRTFWLKPFVARAIASEACATADQICLSIALIYLALWAGGVPIAGDLMALLSARMSVGHFAVLALCWVAWRIFFSYCGLYTWQRVQSAAGVPARVALATGLCALISGEVVASSWHHGQFLRVTVSFWIAAMSGALLLRVTIGLIQIYVRPLFRRRKNAVIVGSGPRALRIREELTANPEWKYEFLGFISPVASSIQGSSDRQLGKLTDLEEILMRQAVDEVIIALPMRFQYAAIERTIGICERVGVQVQYCDDMIEMSHSGYCYREPSDDRRVIFKMVPDDYRLHIKRAMDVAGSLFGLILCAPIFLVVAILIKCTSKGPVIFRQERYGLGRRTFRIFKFRTMVENAEEEQVLLEHMNQNSGPVFKIFKDPRVTKIGAILRRTSIDELPQLINVLKGDMSLVGPRPLNMRDVGRFSESWLMRRFSVRPGLTCLWQIGGRSNVSFDRWIALDLHYIDHWSLQMDLKILALTIPAVFRGTGAA